MIDPIAQVITLLQPSTPYAKLARGSGRWSIRRMEEGKPFYCAVLKGSIRLAIDHQEPVVLGKDEFALIPSVYNFTASSIEQPDTLTTEFRMQPNGEVVHGDPEAPEDFRMLAGYCSFASKEEGLLLSLLPEFVHVRGEKRLSILMGLIREEVREQRPAREVILTRLLEVLLIEALRSTANTDASPGLLRGLADGHLAVSIRRMHERPAEAWTIAGLAKEAALSRSAFFERFHCAVGIPPMKYLLGLRMALARDLLRRGEMTVAEVAEQVGYRSASTFSVAFSRHTGTPPSHYAKQIP